MKSNKGRFKKHIYIPLALCGGIVLIGLWMTLTNTVTYGRVKEFRIGQDKRNAGTRNVPLTGPQVISIGIIMGSVVTYIWVKSKK